MATEPEQTTNPNQDIIDGLRAMADWLAAGHWIPEYTVMQLDVFPSAEQFRQVAREAGKLEKKGSGDYFYLRKEFTPRVYIDFNQRRDQICERVKVGEKIIPATPEMTIPARPEKVEEIFEWKCPPSLLALKAEAEPMTPAEMLDDPRR
jgi:hypothetical protein